MSYRRAIAAGVSPPVLQTGQSRQAGLRNGRRIHAREKKTFYISPLRTQFKMA